MNDPAQISQEQAQAFMAEVERKHKEWLDRRLTRSEWLELLHRCQDGYASCLFVLEKIEHELEVKHIRRDQR